LNVNRLPKTIEITMSVSWTSPQIADVATAKTPLGTDDEARDSERIPICCPVNLAHGNDRIIRGRLLNMSSSGVLIEARRAIKVGSQVRIQGNELLTGTAFVRHATRRLWRCRIGLEFARAVPNRY
jgi:hypothetical protein